MNQFFTNKLRIVFSIILVTFFTLRGNAQALSGTYSIPGSYTTIQDAVNALNLNGVNGPVVFNIGAGSSYTEVLTGSINLGSTTLNASVSSTNTITFQKATSATSNPLITAFTGTKIASSTDSIDAIWSISGTDWVTIDGIDLLDPVANTSNITTMEVGFGLYRASTTDGVNNVTIKNCLITLNRQNTTNGSGSQSKCCWFNWNRVNK